MAAEYGFDPKVLRRFQIRMLKRWSEARRDRYQARNAAADRVVGTRTDTSRSTIRPGGDPVQQNRGADGSVSTTFDLLGMANRMAESGQKRMSQGA